MVSRRPVHSFSAAGRAIRAVPGRHFLCEMLDTVQRGQELCCTVRPLNRVPHDPYQIALARAADLLGGAAALSRRLQVPIDDLRRWLHGPSRPPRGIFLRVVDLVTEERPEPRALRKHR